MLSGRRYSGNKEVRQWGYLYIHSYREGKRIVEKIFKWVIDVVSSAQIIYKTYIVFVYRVEVKNIDYINQAAVKKSL